MATLHVPAETEHKTPLTATEVHAKIEELKVLATSLKDRLPKIPVMTPAANKGIDLVLREIPGTLYAFAPSELIFYRLTHHVAYRLNREGIEQLAASYCLEKLREFAASTEA